jgi:release factor glutamine methyltransferase
MRADDENTGPNTLGALRRAMAARLRDALPGKNASPELDARLLTAEAAGLDPAALPIHADKAAAGDVVERAFLLAARRIAGEPVARIRGRQEFWGLEFLLSPDVLIPRPDTETVVEAALGFAKARAADGGCRVLDLGTGSGAILIALLREVPEASGVGMDIALGAAVVARENARRLGVARRSAFAVADWTAAIGATFDVIVANPPYIPSSAIAELDVEVRGFDPRRALDGGADGLSAMRTLVADLRRVLAPNGCAFMEIGAGQPDAFAALAKVHGFAATFVRDLAGFERVAVLTA